MTEQVLMALCKRQTEAIWLTWRESVGSWTVTGAWPPQQLRQLEELTRSHLEVTARVCRAGEVVALELPQLPAEEQGRFADETIQLLDQLFELRSQLRPCIRLAQESGHSFPAGDEWENVEGKLIQLRTEFVARRGDSVDQETILIRPAAYLRSIAVLFYSAFRWPFKTTYVDLSTGECVHRNEPATAG